MLLFNVSVTCIAAATAGDHSPVQNPSNPNQKRTDASGNASATVLPATNTSPVPSQAAGLVNTRHDDNSNLAADLASDLARHPASNPERVPGLVRELASHLASSSILEANLVNERQTNFSNEQSSLHSPGATEADMRTNLDHLNELNNNNQPIYTDQYVVQLKGGPKLARELSERHGFVYLGEVGAHSAHLLIIY